MTGAHDQLLRENLLDWYHAARRRLPWREEPSPYRVLLSEFMLQQTRVDTVIAYFERFTRRWPTLTDLAQSDEDEVVREWAGLGYYSRARNLHRCAVAAAQAGGIPNTVAELKKLPGIGPYTAGAIASIGFQQPVPLVDGNVERVLSRVDGITSNPRSAPGKAALWARAEALLVADCPGDFNQALMELGALVCTSKRPKCDICPWTGQCEARRLGVQSDLPAIPKKKPPVSIYGSYGLLVLDGALVLGRRPNQGILAGMWEPVGSPWTKENNLDDGALLVNSVRERTGLSVRVSRALGEVVHVFSHRRLRVQVYELELEPPLVEMLPLAFYTHVERAQIPDAFALSTLSRKVMALRRTPVNTLEKGA
jgi:A/G-specific adenine glycosylase